MTGIQKFNQILIQYNSDAPEAQQGVTDAYHNLSGFMSLLIKVNDREQIVPIKPQRETPDEN